MEDFILFYGQVIFHHPPTHPPTHTHTHLLYPFIYGWTLRLLPYLAIVNSAAMNTGVHISFELVLSFSSDKYLEVELLNHMVVLFLIF